MCDDRGGVGISRRTRDGGGNGCQCGCCCYFCAAGYDDGDGLMMWQI